MKRCYPDVVCVRLEREIEETQGRTRIGLNITMTVKAIQTNGHSIGGPIRAMENQNAKARAQKRKAGSCHPVKTRLRKAVTHNLLRSIRDDQALILGSGLADRQRVNQVCNIDAPNIKT